MKLLGWMRHKLKQPSIEPFKEFTSGRHYCLFTKAAHEEQDVYPKSYPGSRNTSNMPNQIHGNPSSKLKPLGVQEQLEDEISITHGDFFHGFLAIGTLGAESPVREPATPKFAAPMENATEAQEEMTKDDLKLINNELEKFLESEAEEGYDLSAGRSSFASIITLGDKPNEGTDLEENVETVLFPLEEYLLASSVEFLKPNDEVKKRKGSLLELFQWRKIALENSKQKYGKTEMKGDLKCKHGREPIKKIMKRLLASPKSSATSTRHNFVPAKKKLTKVLQIFHRKIHPEISRGESDVNKQNKDKVNNILPSGSYISGDFSHQHGDNAILSSGEGSAISDSNFKRPQHQVAGIGLNRKRETWIKTDAEYLVLEF